jgi:hypothetical protein
VAGTGAGRPAQLRRHQLGVITRLSANPQPPADSLYGISIEGLRCDAVALAFDLARWRAHFVAQWPPDSAAYDRCYTGSLTASRYGSSRASVAL